MVNFPATTSNVVARARDLRAPPVPTLPLLPRLRLPARGRAARPPRRRRRAAAPLPRARRQHDRDGPGAAGARAAPAPGRPLARASRPDLARDPGLRERFYAFARASWDNASSLHAGLFQVALARLLAGAAGGARRAALLAELEASATSPSSASRRTRALQKEDLRAGPRGAALRAARAQRAARGRRARARAPAPPACAARASSGSAPRSASAPRAAPRSSPSPKAAGMSAPRVAYLFARYPIPSQTFCDTEMLALEALGLAARDRRARARRSSIFRHERLAKLRAEAHLLPPPRIVRVHALRAERAGRWPTRRGRRLRASATARTPARARSRARRSRSRPGSSGAGSRTCTPTSPRTPRRSRCS